MSTVSALIEKISAYPLLIVYTAGIFILLIPLFTRAGGIRYAFTRFFSGWSLWWNKEGILTKGIILLGLVLFGFIFFRASQDSSSLPSVFGEETIDKNESPVSLMMVDVSGSMANIKGVDRYDLARESFLVLARSAHPSWRVGLVVFSDEAYLARIPSYDRSTLIKDSLDKSITDPDSSFRDFRAGTQISGAIEFGLAVLGRYSSARERSLIIISDMEYPDTKLAVAFSQARTQGINVHLVVVGDVVSRSGNLLEIYFGEAGEAVSVSGPQNMEGLSDFSHAIWRVYPLARDRDDTPPLASFESVSGMKRQERIVFSFLLGILAFVVVARGTFSRRIP